MSVRDDILAALKTALEGTAEEDYPVAIKTVARTLPNLLTANQGSLPLVYIDEGDPETVVLRDSTHTLFAMDLLFVAVCEKGRDPEATANDMLATLKQFCASSPSIGAKVLRYLSSEGMAIDHEQRIHLRVQARLLYSCENGSY